MSSLGIKICALAIVGCSMFGCSVGMAPSGGSPEEVKAAFDKMPLEERVKLTRSSSMPADAKKKKIDEMYAKEGISPPGETGAPAPSTGPPAGVGMPGQGGR